MEWRPCARVLIALPLCAYDMYRHNLETHYIAWFVGGVFVLLALPITFYEVGEVCFALECRPPPPPLLASCQGLCRPLSPSSRSRLSRCRAIALSPSLVALVRTSKSMRACYTRDFESQWRNQTLKQVGGTRFE